MNKSRKYTLIHVASTLAMVVYFLITIGYLFFAPKFQCRHISGKIKVKPNTLFIYNLIRTNRCMESNKPTQTGGKLLIGATAPMVFKTNKILPLQNRSDYCLCALTNRHLSYLYNRVLRI